MTERWDQHNRKGKTLRREDMVHNSKGDLRRRRSKHPRLGQSKTESKKMKGKVQFQVVVLVSVFLSDLKEPHHEIGVFG